KFNGDYALEQLNGEKVLLLQPQTYMNLSGEAIRPLIDYYNIPIDDVLVIFDDLDLPAGKIRLREKGGHGGHNGVRSSIDHLGSKAFNVLRLGVEDRQHLFPLLITYWALFQNRSGSLLRLVLKKQLMLVKHG